ncbi:hypothetical protein L4D20_16655 [Vibrio kyushuensis]|uniref:hypothetical protein n=1 Tax=Vibrio kyushuensis TaxID=2910249 RepID=UPI003D0DE649
MSSNFNINAKKKAQGSFITLLSIFIVGCSSAPREITAKIPLLENQDVMMNFSLVDEQYWSIFENDVITQIQYQTKMAQLDTSYTSALGLHCRTLTYQSPLKDSSVINRVVCREGTQTENASPWYMTNALVEDHTLLHNSQLSGVQ